MLAFGFVFGFVFAIKSANQTEQPQVMLRLSADGSTASGTAQVGDLNSDGRLTVYLNGLRRTGRTTYHPTQLYEAFIGPNGNGEATDTLTVPIPPGRYDAVGLEAFTGERPPSCGLVGPQQQHVRGCVIIQLPNRPDPPQLSASWVGTGSSSNELAVSLTSNVARRSKETNWVLLRVVGIRRGSATVLYKTIVTSATSIMTRDLRLALPLRLSTVCVDAQFLTAAVQPRGLVCPVKSVPAVDEIELQPPR